MQWRRLLIQALAWGFATSYLMVGGASAEEFAESREDDTARRTVSEVRLSRSGTYLGFADRQGQIVIPAVYSDLGTFNEGLACAARDGKYGFINEIGEEVIAFRFDEAGNFSEGFAKVRIGKKWGFVTASGRMLCECRFERVGDFHEGLAEVIERAETNDKAANSRTCGYINSRGQWAIRLDGQALLRPFSQGVAIIEKFREEGGTTFAVISQSGKELWTFAEAQSPRCDFSEGLVAVFDRETHRLGYMNLQGSFVIRPRFVEAGRFSEGLAPVSIAMNGKIAWGYIDKTGALRIPPRFFLAQPFSEGLAWVLMAPGKGGYIDHTGDFVIKPTYWLGSCFKRGFATVKEMEENVRASEDDPVTIWWVPTQNAKHYLIDRAGKRTPLIRLKGELGSGELGQGELGSGRD